MVSSWWGGVIGGNILRRGRSLQELAGGEWAQCGLCTIKIGSSIWRERGVPDRECHLVSPTAEAVALGSGLLKVWWCWSAGVGSIVAITVRSFSLGCRSPWCFVEPVKGFSPRYIVDWLNSLEGEVI